MFYGKEIKLFVRMLTHLTAPTCQPQKLTVILSYYSAYKKERLWGIAQVIKTIFTDPDGIPKVFNHTFIVIVINIAIKYKYK